MLHSTDPSYSPAVPSLQPALEGRLILDYQQLEFGPDNATLRWQYYPDPSAPCTDTSYRVELYKLEDITNALLENELEPFHVFESAREFLSLPVGFVNVEENYFRVSAIDASDSTCASMEYYTALLDNGKAETCICKVKEGKIHIRWTVFRLPEYGDCLMNCKSLRASIQNVFLLVIRGSLYLTCMLLHGTSTCKAGP